MAQLTDIDSQVSDFFKIKSLDTFLTNLFQIILSLGSIITLAYLLWGGIEYISSGGNQDQTKAAKDKISQALIGLTILAVIWVVWRLVIYFLGFSSDPQGTFQINIPEP